MGLPDSYKILAEVQHSGMCALVQPFGLFIPWRVLVLPSPNANCPYVQVLLSETTEDNPIVIWVLTELSDPTRRRCLHHWRWFDSSIGLWSCWRWYNESVRKYGEFLLNRHFPYRYFLCPMWERWFYPTNIIWHQRVPSRMHRLVVCSTVTCSVFIPQVTSSAALFMSALMLRLFCLVRGILFPMFLRQRRRRRVCYFYRLRDDES